MIRAAITLKLCNFEESGAIVAALTTSIPEAHGTIRNWDYRYCWLRDAFFIVRALNSLSEVGTMERYLQWLYDVVRFADEPLADLAAIPLHYVSRLARREVKVVLSGEGADEERAEAQGHGLLRVDLGSFIN